MIQSWALVTGASSGIGKEYARILAAKNYSIVLVSNQEKACQECASEIRKSFGVDTKVLFIDLSKQDAAQHVFDFCLAEQIKIDVLVNNAGMFFWKLFIEADITKIQTMLNLHINTTTLLCRLFAKSMQEQGHGFILNASSICAWMNYPTISIYGASKSYLKSFSTSLHYEMKPYGVSVCHVAPGAVDTSLYGMNEKTRHRLCFWHIMLKPHQVAKKGIQGLFKGKKVVVPGKINWIFIVLVCIVPTRFINFLRQKIYRPNI